MIRPVYSSVFQNKAFTVCNISVSAVYSHSLAVEVYLYVLISEDLCLYSNIFCQLYCFSCLYSFFNVRCSSCFCRYLLVCCHCIVEASLLDSVRLECQFHAVLQRSVFTQHVAVFKSFAVCYLVILQDTESLFSVSLCNFTVVHTVEARQGFPSACDSIVHQTAGSVLDFNVYIRIYCSVNCHCRVFLLCSSRDDIIVRACRFRQVHHYFVGFEGVLHVVRVALKICKCASPDQQQYCKCYRKSCCKHFLLVHLLAFPPWNIK